MEKNIQERYSASARVNLALFVISIVLITLVYQANRHWEDSVKSTFVSALPAIATEISYWITFAPAIIALLLSICAIIANTRKRARLSFYLSQAGNIVFSMGIVILIAAIIVVYRQIGAF